MGWLEGGFWTDGVLGHYTSDHRLLWEGKTGGGPHRADGASVFALVRGEPAHVYTWSTAGVPPRAPALHMSDQDAANVTGDPRAGAAVGRAYDPAKEACGAVVTDPSGDVDVPHPGLAGVLLLVGLAAGRRLRARRWIG